MLESDHLRPNLSRAATSRCRGAVNRLKEARKAPVAQLDRALPSEGKGHTFESCRVRQPNQVHIEFLPKPNLARVSMLVALPRTTKLRSPCGRLFAWSSSSVIDDGAPLGAPEVRVRVRLVCNPTQRRAHPRCHRSAPSRGNHFIRHCWQARTMQAKRCRTHVGSYT
jgi:hypothetical protein